MCVANQVRYTVSVVVYYFFLSHFDSNPKKKNWFLFFFFHTAKKLLDQTTKFIFPFQIYSLSKWAVVFFFVYQPQREFIHPMKDNSRKIWTFNLNRKQPTKFNAFRSFEVNVKLLNRLPSNVLQKKKKNQTQNIVFRFKCETNCLNKSQRKNKERKTKKKTKFNIKYVYQINPIVNECCKRNEH